MQTEDYVTTVTLGAAIAALTLMVPRPPAGFQRGALFDDAVLDVLAAPERAEQRGFALVSDVLQNGLIVAPALLDVGATALIDRGDTSLAWNLLWMQFEAFAISSGAIMLTKRTIGRVRPGITPCEDGGFGCRSNTSRRAFLSGHATASFTGAGLLCLTHQQLELWGDAGDAAVCSAALIAASGATVLRVVAEEHWPTDTIAGAIVGLFAGYVAPYLLHFAKRDPRVADPTDGAIGLLLSSGAFVRDGRASFAAGFDTTLAHRQWLTPQIGVFVGADGRLLQATQGSSVRRAAPSVGLAFGDVVAGFALDYRAIDDDGDAFTELTGGPELKFRVRDAEASSLELTMRWLPLFDGTSNRFMGRVDVALLENVALRADVSPIGDDATIVVGAGGRIPW